MEDRNSTFHKNNLNVTKDKDDYDTIRLTELSLNEDL
jgi:hypothetical protein